MRTSVQIMMVCLLASGPALFAQESGSQSLSLRQIFEAINGSAATKTLVQKLEERRSRQEEAGTQVVGAFEFEVESAFGSETGKAESLEGLISQSYRLGVDDDAVREASRLEAEAAKGQMQGELSEQLATTAHMYLDLLTAQRKAEATKGHLQILSPLVEKVQRGIQSGTASTLAALRWKLLSKELEAELAGAKSTFAALAEALAEATGTSIPKDLEKVALKAVPKTESPGLKADDAYQVKALRAQAKAKQLRAQNVRDAYEISAGLGLERAYEEEGRSYLAKISFPLGQSLANRSQARVEEAEAELLQAEESVVRAGLVKKLALLTGELTAKRLTHETAESLAKEIRTIYETSASGLGRGLTSAAEVIEALEALHEADMAAADALKEYESVLVDIYSLKGKIP